MKIIKDVPPSKIIIAGLLCLLIGGLLPYLFVSFPEKLFLFVGLLFLFLVVLFLKKGKITVYDWLILICVGIPFHGFRIMFGSFFLRITELFFIPFLIWGSVQIFQDKEKLRNLFRLPFEYLILLFFCAFTLMSTILSENIFISSYRTIVLFYLAGMAFLISRLFDDKQKIYFIIKVMITISSIACVFAIFQSFIPALQMMRPIPLAKIGALTVFRSGVGWRNPNYFAFYVSLLLPITYVCKISDHFPEKRFFKICFILQVIGLLCSYSRLGVISISLTFLCFLWVRGKKFLASAIFVALLVLPIIAFLNMEYIYKNNRYLAASIFRIARFEAVNKNPLLIAGWRRDAWLANVSMFLDRPFLGLGPFMSTEMYSEYKPIDQIYPWEDLAVHNEYLSLLSERGSIGFILFVLFMFLVLNRAIVFYEKNKTTPQGMLMLGFWASIVNFAWFSFGAATIYSVQFWLNVGMIFALTRFSNQDRIKEINDQNNSNS